MSSLQKNMFKNKILAKEQELRRSGIFNTDIEDEEDEDKLSEEDQDKFPESLSLPNHRRPSRCHDTIIQRTWKDYFKENFVVKVQNGQDICHFNVYYSPPDGPDAPIFIFHHGAGSNGLTFAVMASKLQELIAKDSESTPLKADSQITAGIMAFDMRGHGKTTVDGPGTHDFSMTTLCNDMYGLYKAMVELKNWNSPPLILVGHSLGGAVVTKTSSTNQFQHLIGLAVLDAVEEYAIEALTSMDAVLDRFPTKFKTEIAAIDWHLSTMALRNREAASVSVPASLTPSEGELIWVTDLRKTKPFWKDWFEGLSSSFLKVPAARLLILAGNDHLDKELMIGQMQGKYQLVVFAESGHFIQEDAPDKTALTLVDFWMRNGRPSNVVPLFGKFRDP